MPTAALKAIEAEITEGNLVSEWVEEKTGLTLSDSQREAVQQVMRRDSQFESCARFACDLGTKTFKSI
jgi:hypothetical protein